MDSNRAGVGWSTIMVFILPIIIFLFTFTNPEIGLLFVKFVAFIFIDGQLLEF